MQNYASNSLTKPNGEKLVSFGFTSRCNSTKHFLQCPLYLFLISMSPTAVFKLYNRKGIRRLKSKFEDKTLNLPIQTVQNELSNRKKLTQLTDLAIAFQGRRKKREAAGALIFLSRCSIISTVEQISTLIGTIIFVA